jgi:hypothetical protein
MRPQLEVLEAIVSLSGGMSSGAAINLPMIPAGSHPLFPLGTIEGVYVEHGTGSTPQFTASGSLSPLGETTEVGSLGKTDTVTIQTRTRNVTLQLSPPGRAGHFDYGITKGIYGITKTTGSYAGDQGAGTVVVRLGRPHKETLADTRSGLVRLTFGAYPTPVF